MRRRHGQLSTLFLSYDCTFLALLLAAVYEEEEGFEKCRCPARSGCGLRGVCGRQRVRDRGALAFAADVNVILSYYKCADNWADERKLHGLLGKWALAGAMRRLRRRRGAFCEEIAGHMETLRVLEEKQSACPDEACAPFAALMETVGREFSDSDEKAVAPLRWLLYNLGRWVYLLDAWDDRERDRKSGAFNSFLRPNTTREDAEFLIYLSLNEACNALDLLDLRRNEGILRNVLDLGCRDVTGGKLKVER